MIVGLAAAGLLSAGFTGTALAGGEAWGRGGVTCVPTKGADCAGVNHKWKVDADGKNLTGINLKQAKLHGASLQGADLSDANLNQVVLKYADMDGAELDGARMRGAKLHHVDFSGVDASDADLSGASVKFATIRGTSFAGADLRGATIKSSTISDSDYFEQDREAPQWRFNARPKSLANSTGTRLAYSVWTDVSVEGTDFTDSTAQYVLWRNSQFRHDNFTRVNFTGGQFSRVDFAYSNFTGADFTGAAFDPQTLGSMTQAVIDRIVLEDVRVDNLSPGTPMIFTIVNNSDTWAGMDVDNGVTQRVSRSVESDETAYFFATRNGGGVTGQLDGVPFKVTFNPSGGGELMWGGQSIALETGKNSTEYYISTLGTRVYLTEVRTDSPRSQAFYIRLTIEDP